MSLKKTIRRLFLLDLIFEITFWLGALGGILIGIFYAQRKGSEFKKDFKQAYKKEGVKASAPVVWDELKSVVGEAIKDGITYIKSEEVQNFVQMETRKIRENVGGTPKKAAPASKKRSKK